ncbi:MAG: hypothetical protein K2L34_14100, partial [Muribaculaceae bacterium]|nr:hypothetical protein [Muribaculaceae bacterium]
RIGKGKSLYGSVPRYNRDSLMYCAPDLYWQMEAASFEKDPREHDRTALQRIICLPPSSEYRNLLHIEIIIFFVNIK